jgi:hypothetical protein
MNNLIKESLVNNKILKLVSLALGFITWSLVWNHQPSCNWIEVPVCFYNIPTQMKVTANQEKMKIQVQGKLADINQCNNLALHIDARNFEPGQRCIYPDSELLFLPSSVKLVHSKPLFLQITTTVV